MNESIEEAINAQVSALGLGGMDESFTSKIDWYLGEYFADESSLNQFVIACYLADVGMRIAKADGKQRVEADDAKAAIWLFHERKGVDDRCRSAGKEILAIEAGLSFGVAASAHFSQAMLSPTFQSLIAGAKRAIRDDGRLGGGYMTMGN